MTKRGAFTLETARTILDQSKRFDQIAARAGMGGDLRKRKPQQFRLALVTATSDEDSTSSDCGEVNVVRIQLIDATFAEQLGTRQLEKSLVPKKLYFAAVPIGSDVTVGDVIEVAWWNKRYWFLGSVTSPCGASSGSASDFSTSVSGSDGINSGDPSASASGGGDPSISTSGGAGSGSGSGSGSLIECTGCGGPTVPTQLTVTIDCFELDFNNIPPTPPASRQCVTEATLVHNGTAWVVELADDVSFGNIDSTDCSGLDGDYRLTANFNCDRLQFCRVNKNNPADFACTAVTIRSITNCSPFQWGSYDMYMPVGSTTLGFHVTVTE